MATVEELKAAVAGLADEVSQTADVQGSAIALIGGLKTKLDEALAAGSPQDVVDQIVALRNELDTQQAALAAAITANTPAAPAPEAPAES
jgi:hypothetical protein